jgi:hypothetical protein
MPELLSLGCFLDEAILPVAAERCQTVTPLPVCLIAPTVRRIFLPSFHQSDLGGLPVMLQLSRAVLAVVACLATSTALWRNRRKTWRWNGHD